MFTTYENEGFGFDVIITAYDCQEPFLNKQFTPCLQYDPDFIEMMKGKEKEHYQFLKDFYDETIPLRYENIDKICQIKEIEYPEDEEIGQKE